MLDVMQRFFRLVGCGQCVRAVCFGDRADDGVFEIHRAVAALDLTAELYVRHVAHGNRRVFDEFNDCVAQVIERGDPRHARNDVFLTRHLQKSAGNVDVGFLERLAHLGHADVVGAQAIGVEEHLILLHVAADGNDGRDAAQRQDARTDLPIGNRAQLHRRTRVTLQTVLDHPADGGGDRQHHRRTRADGKPLADGLGSFIHQLPRHIDIRPPAKHDHDRGQSDRRSGTHFVHARCAVDGALDGKCN